MLDGMHTLPVGWEAVRLDNFVAGRTLTVNPASRPDAEFTLYSVPAHAVGRPEILAGGAIGSSKVCVTPGTVLLCKINPRINRVWVVADRGGPEPNLIASTEWITFPASPAFMPEYLRFFLMREPVRAYLAATASGVGGSLMRSNAGVAGAISLPLAPLPEQRRIVAAIEALFADLDEAEAALARARAGLEEYRASLLHAACTGQLTTAWRASRPPPAEDGPALLRRILSERRAAWDRAERARLHARGKPAPVGEAWKARYLQPGAANPDGWPDLPDTWTWATIEQMLGEPARNGISVEGRLEPPGTPALRLDALTNDGLLFDRRRYIDIPDAKADDLSIVAGDFLVSRGNGSLRLVGRGCLASTPPEPTVFPDTMIRLRFVLPSLGAWVNAVWQSGLVRQQIEAEAKTTAGIWKIGQDVLHRVAIPLPPEDELQAALTQLGETRLDADSWPNNAATVRQSILHAAFTGRLVPQNPTDEPAAFLLARLRAASAVPRRTRKQALTP